MKFHCDKNIRNNANTKATERERKNPMHNFYNQAHSSSASLLFNFMLLFFQQIFANRHKKKRLFLSIPQRSFNNIKFLFISSSCSSCVPMQRKHFPNPFWHCIISPRQNRQIQIVPRLRCNYAENTQLQSIADNN